ncbi:MAG: hypothetical protein HY233_10425 [Acidobacteriales bacterium]|nr:hypothetical protein [Candidatus Koribacter versatilis]MBI3646366.1 hypothetical protein [Terriglobales bacterium]
MSDVPKIVYDRLRAGTPVGAHPDADVLAAFAEQVLPAAECEDVVQHLARCRDCREVLALSLPPMEAVAKPEADREVVAAVPVSAGRASAEPRNWLAWTNLRWAALAAGVVVVASVLMLRPGKQPESMVATVNRQAENAVPATSDAKPTVSSADQPAESAAAKAVKPDTSILRERPVLGMVESPPARTQTPALPAASGALADNKRVDALALDKRAAKIPAAPAVSASGGIAAPEHVGVSSETVEVTNEAASMAQAAPAQNRLMARSELSAPIQKAKVATKEETELKAQTKDAEAQKKQLKSAIAAPDRAFGARKLQSKDVAAQWNFAQGMLRRSLDGGASWQTTLQLDRPLLCFGAQGSDVWAGGQAGTLFHSSDGGTTWVQVQPSTKAESLSTDIVAIEIRGPAEIVLSTSTKESWTTADGGKTWEKK